MKLRRYSSRRKWSNRFYKLEKAASIHVVTDEFLGPNNERDALARHMASLSLDDWLATNAIGEVGEREIDSSPYAPWQYEMQGVMYRASVMAKRPYWSKHKRAEARA